MFKCANVDKNILFLLLCIKQSHSSWYKGPPEALGVGLGAISL